MIQVRNLHRLLNTILAVIKDYGDTFKGFRQKGAPEKRNRGVQTAVQTPKNLNFLCMQGHRESNTKSRSSNAISPISIKGIKIVTSK